MVSQVGRYYGALLTGSRGVTHDKYLSPTIFIMVVDTVMYYWAIRGTREEAET